jgi:hypothetical protein
MRYDGGDHNPHLPIVLLWSLPVKSRLHHLGRADLHVMVDAFHDVFHLIIQEGCPCEMNQRASRWEMAEPWSRIRIVLSQAVYLKRVGAPDEWRRNSASEMQRRESGMETSLATTHTRSAQLLAVLARKKGVERGPLAELL